MSSLSPGSERLESLLPSTHDVWRLQHDGWLFANTYSAKHSSNRHLKLPLGSYSFVLACLRISPWLSRWVR